jgi:hypothetical protein
MFEASACLGGFSTCDRRKRHQCTIAYSGSRVFLCNSNQESFSHDRPGDFTSICSQMAFLENVTIVSRVLEQALLLKDHDAREMFLSSELLAPSSSNRS